MAPVLLCLSVSCATGLRGEVFRKGDLRYRIGVPPVERWAPVSLGDNDLAWISKKSGHVIAVNSTCDDHGDPSLEVLTNHLLMGFSDRQLEFQKTEMRDEREALRSRYHAHLDGVPVSIELVVLKRNGCVHDFTAIRPDGPETVTWTQADFNALVDAFHQEHAP